MSERKVALVTGAGHRVGRAFAVALGKRGYDVAVHFNAAAEPADETVSLIEEGGGKAQKFSCDLTSADGPATLVKSVFDRMSRLDVVVNSAAVMLRTPVDEIAVDVWDKIFALNLRAPFFVAQAAAKVMAEGGVIINIADLAAYETWPAYVPHAISKAGIVKMTESLARVLAPKLRVNAIAPGAILLPDDWDEETAKKFASTTPLQRLGSPDDAVAAMLYLLDAEYVTGETVVVDGGRRIRK
ncbi:MAG TPA: SDR family oxidoreductase [Gemmatimonadaceae bacterium]|nr:SDR family oxidoreductase [Gemmatimonadaceae bacterium]